MESVAVRELRNNTRGLLERVNAGETVQITIDGRPAAELRPLADRPIFLSRAAFVQALVPHQADAALSEVLAELSPDTTDDVPL